MKYDVIIIGSGLGGLECAHILARSGMHVLVLEQGAQPGGCMQSYRRKGQSFDTGLHYVGGLGDGQSLHAAFKYLGLTDLPWHQLDKDGFDKVTIEDRTFPLAQGYNQFAEQLSRYFPSENVGLRHYTNLLASSAAEQMDALAPSTFQPDYTGTLMATGAWEFLEKNFSDPLLRNVLSGTSLKMELRKESLPLFSFLHGNSSFIESSWRLKGDGSLIVEKLTEGIRSMGGEVVCHAKVEELVEKDGKLTCAVLANGERYEADWFISDIHPALTCDLVKESSRMKRVYRRRMSGVSNSFGMFTVSLSFQPGTLPYFNYNQYIYTQPDIWEIHENPEDGVRGVLVSCRVPEDGSQYTQQVDILTPMSWTTCQQWVDTKIGRRGKEYEELKEKMADECIDLAATIFPQLKDYTLRYTSTPLTWFDYTLTPEGSAYGMRKDYQLPLLTVLSPRTPIPNLLLTGQNLMLHGVHGVTMTSFHTCAEILGKEKMWDIVGQERERQANN